MYQLKVKSFLCLLLYGELITLVFPAEVYNRGYVGCYNYTSNMDQYQQYQRVTLSSNITNHACIQACLHQSSTMQYAGFMAGKDCYCGHGYNQTFLTETAQCSLTCLGNATQMCGHWTKMTIYNTEYEKIPLFSIPSDEANFMDIWNFAAYGNSFNGSIFRSGFIDSWNSGAKIPEYVTFVALNQNGQDLFSLDFFTNYSSANLNNWLVKAKIVSSSVAMDLNSLQLDKSDSLIQLVDATGRGVIFAHGQVHFDLPTATVISRDGNPVSILNNTDYQYVGCISRFDTWSTIYQYVATDMSVSTCQARCHTLNLSYFLVQDNNRCYCTNISDLNNQTFYSNASCDVICTNSTDQTCGSKNYLLQHYHVTTLPPLSSSEYCLNEADLSESVLVFNFEETGTKADCTSRCTAESFAYAVYQDVVSSCSCSNNISNSSYSTTCQEDMTGYYSFYNASTANSHWCRQISNTQPTFVEKMINTGMTVISCANHCNDKGYSYAVLMNAQICYCTNILEGSEVSETYCPKNCTDGNWCGASIGYFSVYKDLYIPNYSEEQSLLKTEVITLTTNTTIINFNSDAFINGFKLQGPADTYRLRYRYTVTEGYLSILDGQWLTTGVQYNFPLLRVTNLLITLNTGPLSSGTQYTYDVFTPGKMIQIPEKRRQETIDYYNDVNISWWVLFCRPVQGLQLHLKEKDLLKVNRIAVFGFYHEEEPKVSKWEFLNGLSEAEILNRLKGLLDEMRAEAEVPTSNLSSSTRQKTSARDGRTSSQGIGILGTFFIGCILVMMLAADVPVLKMHLKICWENVSSIWTPEPKK